MPRTSFSTDVAVDGPPESSVPEPTPAAISTPPITAALAAHPTTNAGPLTRPRGELTSNTEAMIGIGLSATPTAIVNICPIA